MIEALEDLNFDSMEEQFGEKLAAEIKNNVEHCNERGTNYQIKIIDETNHFITIAFATYAYTYLYEISKKRKDIYGENRIGSCDCRKVLEIMDKLKEKEKQ